MYRIFADTQPSAGGWVLSARMVDSAQSYLNVMEQWSVEARCELMPADVSSVVEPRAAGADKQAGSTRCALKASVCFPSSQLLLLLLPPVSVTNPPFTTCPPPLPLPSWPCPRVRPAGCVPLSERLADAMSSRPTRQHHPPGAPAVHYGGAD